MFNKKTKDPLVESVKRVLSDSDGNRKIEAELNEELGIYNRNELPFEFRANYDAMLKQRINENKIPGKPSNPKAQRSLSAKQRELIAAELKDFLEGMNNIKQKIGNLKIDKTGKLKNQNTEETPGKKLDEARKPQKGEWVRNPSLGQRIGDAVRKAKYSLPLAASTAATTAMTAKMGGLSGTTAAAAGFAAGAVAPITDVAYTLKNNKDGFVRENLDAIKDEIRTKILETLETLHSKGLKEEFDKYYSSLTPDQLDLIEDDASKWDNSTRDTSSKINQQPPQHGPPMVVSKSNMMMPNPVQVQNQGTLKRPIAPPMVAPTAGENPLKPAEALRRMFRKSGDDEQVTKKSALSESTKPVKMSLESALRHYGPGNIPNDKKIQESFESFLRKKLPE